jgi:hypothetical protein
MSKAEILDELPRLEPGERREILEQLWALEERELTPSHQQLVDEALASGPALPGTEEDWSNALRRGLDQARNLA